MNKILIVLTPFHLEMIKLISKDYSVDLNGAIVFYSNYISLNRLKSELGQNITPVPIPSGTISIINFLRNPRKQLSYLRKLFKRFETSIETSLDNSKYEVFLGSDKDVFTQILISYLINYNNLYRAYAIDEGIGYYRKKQTIDYLFKYIYKLFSKLLFNYTINYVSVLGTSDWINIIYARYPDEVTATKKIILQINTIQKKIRAIKDLNQVLLLTSPLSEDKLISPTLELKQYGNLIDKYLRLGYKITIKQHPRELNNKLALYSKNVNITFISSSIPAESIDFSDFTLIINFGTSTILTILDQDYPPKRIKTFRLSKKIILPDRFKLTEISSF